MRSLFPTMKLHFTSRSLGREKSQNKTSFDRPFILFDRRALMAKSVIRIKHICNAYYLF